MTTMLDRMRTLRHFDYNPALSESKVRGWLDVICRKAAPFVIDNVTEYVFATSSKADWDTDDYPCLTPPFPLVWLETKRPSCINHGPSLLRSGRKQISSDHMPEHWGLGFQSERLPDKGWQVSAMLVLEQRKGEFTVPGYFLFMTLDEQGLIKEYDPTFTLPEGFDEQQAADNTGIMTIWSRPALLALSFCHCKNVRTAEVTPPPKLSKAHERRHKKPLVRYHTLEIDPMREILRREGGSDKVGLQQALHICRGHFKDYRESGLFGRNKGLYWWDQHLRGQAQEGTVLKDYRVVGQKARRIGEHVTDVSGPTKSREEFLGT